jgi:hypothetical protein
VIAAHVVYDRGMSELVPCGECRRHVSVGDAACPFCGTAREVSAPAAPRGTLSRMSRAAVFAGAALATTACGGNKPKAETVDNQATQQVDAGVDETSPDGMGRSHPDHHNIPMPYGAPPARSRLV